MPYGKSTNTVLENINLQQIQCSRAYLPQVVCGHNTAYSERDDVFCSSILEEREIPVCLIRTSGSRILRWIHTQILHRQHTGGLPAARAHTGLHTPRRASRRVCVGGVSYPKNSTVLGTYISMNMREKHTGGIHFSHRAASVL